MLFLLGVRTHPIVSILIGLAMIAVGIGLHLIVTPVLGAGAVVWGGYAWRRRSRNVGAR